MLELLSTIYNSQVPIEMQRLSDTDRRVLAENVQKQAKSNRIEEWKSFPLNTDEERLSWWSRRQDLIRKGIEAGSSHASQESPAQTEPWVMESSPVVAQHYEDVRSSVVDGSNLPFAQQPRLAQAAWQLAPDVLGVPEPAPGLLHQDQDMTAMSPRGNLGNEAYSTGDGRPEPVAPSVGTSLDSRPSTTEQWRKYF